MNRFLILCTASVLALSACASPSDTRPPVDLNFMQMSAVPLSVGTVQVLNASVPSAAPKNIALKNAAPEVALERYAAQRLKAAGGQGTLNFIIQQASITSQEVLPEGNGWKDKLELGKPTEHTVIMKVGIDLVGVPGQPEMKSAYSLERKLTVPAQASLEDRDWQINNLIASMVKDMDSSVLKGLNENMHVVIGPGPITFGNSMPINNPNNQIPVMLNNAH